MADLKTKMGTKLSKAAVDKFASEAEAGYDLSKGSDSESGVPHSLRASLHASATG